MPTTQSQAFTANGVFVVPAGVSLVMLTGLVGAAVVRLHHRATQAKGNSGGGSGEFVHRQPFKVTPLAAITVVVGIGGAGGNNAGSVPLAPGANGGDTLFGSFIIRGGGGVR
jgi:hypothetical protein